MMDPKTMLIAVLIAVGMPSVAYLISERYSVVALNTVPAAIVVDGWTGKTRLTAGD